MSPVLLDTEEAYEQGAEAEIEHTDMAPHQGAVTVMSKAVTFLSTLVKSMHL